DELPAFHPRPLKAACWLQKHGSARGRRRTRQRRSRKAARRRKAPCPVPRAPVSKGCLPARKWVGSLEGRRTKFYLSQAWRPHPRLCTCRPRRNPSPVREGGDPLPTGERKKLKCLP